MQLFDNIEDIREINHRIAECKNKNIYTRNYIPPQYYERYMHINTKCNEMRSSNPTLKTKMRFGPKGIEVLTKTKGSPEPYRIIPLNSIDKTENIPKYDHSRTWKTRTDKPPRRTPNYNPNKEEPPSASGHKTTHTLSKENSYNGEHKKARKKQHWQQWWTGNYWQWQCWDDGWRIPWISNLASNKYKLIDYCSS